MKHLDHFLLWLRVQNTYAPNTIKAYHEYIEELLAFTLRNFGTDDPASITPDMLEQWLIAHQAWSLATRKVHIIAVRRFFDYLVKSRRVEESPCGILPSVNVRRRIDESAGDKEDRVYSSDELIALIEYKDVRFRSTAIRDKAIIALMAASGLRASEVAWLNVGNILHRDGNIIFALRKGQHIKKVAVAPFAWKYIDDYLCLRENLTEDSPLFVTRKGTRIDAKDIWHELNVRQKALGLRSGTHNIRYTVLNSVERISDAVVARDIAGQKSIAVTNGYLVSKQDERVSAISSLPWAEKLSK